MSYTIFCHCSYNEWNFSKKTSHVYLKFHPSVLNIRNKTPLISCVNLLFLIKIFQKYKKIFESKENISMSIQIPLFLEIQLLNSEISNTMHLI